MSATYRALLKSKLASLSKAGRRAFIKRPVRWAYPSRAEAQLNATLVKLFTVFIDKILLYMSIGKPLYNNERRKDSFESDFERYLREQAALMTAESILTFTPGTIEKAVDEAVELIKRTNTTEMIKYFTKTLGTQPPYTDEWWRDIRIATKKAIIDSSVQSIKSFYDNVANYTILSIKEGKPFAEIVKGVQSMGNALTEYRASFLARDIIGTYNSQAQFVIQTTIMGIWTYMWGTMGDERVRGEPSGKNAKAVPSHWMMSRMICKWEDPSVYSTDGNKWLPRESKMPTVHPGQAPNCRCGGVPYDVNRMNALLKEIEAEFA